jgi:hypothetical protein
MSLLTCVLAVGVHPAFGQEAPAPRPTAPATQPPATIPLPSPSAVSQPGAELPPLPTLTEAECCQPGTAHLLGRRPLRCPTCGGPIGGSDRGCCQECGKRQKKVARFLDWLIYIPLDHGKTKCCGCQTEPPPAWAFFPCEGCRGRNCAGCSVAGASAYYTKAPQAVGPAAPAAQVVESAYRADSAKNPAEKPQPASNMLVTATKAASPPVAPKGVANSMPVLDPAQYRRTDAGK